MTRMKTIALIDARLEIPGVNRAKIRAHLGFLYVRVLRRSWGAPAG